MTKQKLENIIFIGGNGRGGSGLKPPDRKPGEGEG